MSLLQLLETLPVDDLREINQPLRALVIQPPSPIPPSSSSGTIELYVLVTRGRIQASSTVGFMSCSSHSEGLVINCKVKKMFVVESLTNPSAGGKASAHYTNTIASRVEVHVLYAGQCGIVLLEPKNPSIASSQDKFSPLEILRQEGPRVGGIIAKGPSISACRASISFQCMIKTCPQLQTPIIPGSSFDMYCHGLTVPCVVKRLCFMMDSSGSRSSTAVKCISSRQLASVEIATEVPTVLEPISLPHHFQRNSRFVLRYKGVTVATGVCEKHLKRS